MSSPPIAPPVTEARVHEIVNVALSGMEPERQAELRRQIQVLEASMPQMTEALERLKSVPIAELSEVLSPAYLQQLVREVVLEQIHSGALQLTIKLTPRS